MLASQIPQSLNFEPRGVVCAEINWKLPKDANAINLFAPENGHLVKIRPGFRKRKNEFFKKPDLFWIDDRQ